MNITEPGIEPANCRAQAEARYRLCYPIPLKHLSHLNMRKPVVVVFYMRVSYNFSTYQIRNFETVAEQPGLSRTWSEALDTGFLTTRLICVNRLAKAIHIDYNTKGGGPSRRE